MTSKPEAGFREEARRLSQAAGERGLGLRLVGAMAFRLHCPRFGHFQDALGRVFTDIDFAARSAQSRAIQAFFRDMGYEEDVGVATLFGEGRLLFNDPTTGRHCDVFLDQLDFCHRIVLKDRLDVDPLTIPLAELLLEKMQIVKINEKDVIDTIMLLREHAIGSTDEETLNVAHVARLAASDWGLWRTITENLGKVRAKLHAYSQVSPEDVADVAAKVDGILDAIRREPKSLGWKMRNRVGDRVKWYKDVDELA